MGQWTIRISSDFQTRSARDASEGGSSLADFAGR
jgi:hypothetical protein